MPVCGYGTSRNGQLRACSIKKFRRVHVMRNLLRVVALLTPVLLALPVAAQNYPDHPVKLIVPFGAGGPADVYARFLAKYLTDETKQSFVVEDRPGAGSIIGTDQVAKSRPDGYTLLLMSNTHTVNETLLPNKPF